MTVSAGFAFATTWHKKPPFPAAVL